MTARLLLMTSIIVIGVSIIAYQQGRDDKASDTYERCVQILGGDREPACRSLLQHP